MKVHNFLESDWGASLCPPDYRTLSAAGKEKHGRIRPTHTFQLPALLIETVGICEGESVLADHPGVEILELANKMIYNLYIFDRKVRRNA